MSSFVNLSFLWKDINRSAAETKEISIMVLEQLEHQEQSIINTNKNLNESKDLIDKSDKLLNDMSWIGWFKSFIPFKSLFSRIFRRTNKEDILFLDNKEFNKEEKYNPEDERNTLIALNCHLEKKEDPEILKLEKELSDLLWINSKIGEHLDLHNNCLDKMNDKSQIILDKTKNSTKKTTDFL